MHDSRRGWGIAAAILWGSGALGSGSGCADPCFDDGLAQGGCPERETETTAADATAGDATTTGGTVDDTGVPTGGGSGIECPMLEEVLLPQVPTFQLVVDKSGSMDGAFDAGATRWEATVNTLVGADGVVTQLQSSIRFGISLYDNSGGSCPTVITLPAQLDAADEIQGLLAGEQPGSGTPTGEAIEEITTELLADDWEGDKVMVLTTDGEPDTCAVPNPQGQGELDQVRGVAVDAVTSAFDQGVRTFVISVGDEVGEDHLQDLANAGVGQQAGDPDAPFWVANDTDSLVDAFDAIVAGLRPCEFALEYPVPAGQEQVCSVTINDVEFPFDAADGWVLPDDSTLALQGAACDAIQMGVVSVRFECSCG